MAIGIGTAIAASGALSAGSSLIGSGKSSSASKSAANAQLSMYNTTRGDLSPYNTAGQSVLSDLTTAAKAQPSTNYLSKAMAAMPDSVMTQADLEKTPGYQFQLAQGLKSTQAAAAARGLGVSGASLKGAATYATGLADANYQNQWNNSQTVFQNWLNLNTASQSNLTNTYNRLSGVASLGESAAAQTGAAGTQAASNYGNYLNQAGQASAAGTTGASNAITGAANNYLTYSALQSALNNTGTGATQNLSFSGYAPTIQAGTQNYLGTGFSTPAAT